MDESKATGKISSTFLEKVVFPRLGARRPEILIGPAPGVDTCVIKIGSNRVPRRLYRSAFSHSGFRCQGFRMDVGEFDCQ